MQISSNRKHTAKAPRAYARLVAYFTAEATRGATHYALLNDTYDRLDKKQQQCTKLNIPEIDNAWTPAASKTIGVDCCTASCTGVPRRLRSSVTKRDLLTALND